jgi:hypothetical protein
MGRSRPGSKLSAHLQQYLTDVCPLKNVLTITGVAAKSIKTRAEYGHDKNLMIAYRNYSQLVGGRHNLIRRREIIFRLVKLISGLGIYSENSEISVR